MTEEEDKAEMLRKAVSRVYAWNKAATDVPPDVSIALGMMTACTLETVRQLEGKK